MKSCVHRPRLVESKILTIPSRVGMITSPIFCFSCTPIQLLLVKLNTDRLTVQDTRHQQHHDNS